MKSYTGTHPVGEGTYSTVQVTLCALFVLVSRAGVTATELTPEWLLTTLWVLDSYNSQYMQDLSTCLKQYLHGYTSSRTGSSSSILSGEASPEEKTFVVELKKVLPKMQMQLLKRCDWYVSVHENRDLKPAGDVLSATQEFWPLCMKVVRKSRDMTTAYHAWVANNNNGSSGSGSGSGVVAGASADVTINLAPQGTITTSTTRERGGNRQMYSTSHSYLENSVNNRGLSMLNIITSGGGSGDIVLHLNDLETGDCRSLANQCNSNHYAAAAAADVAGFSQPWSLCSFNSLF
jgi:hypothetical protein